MARIELSDNGSWLLVLSCLLSCYFASIEIMVEYIFCKGFGHKNNLVAVYPNYILIGLANYTLGRIEFDTEKLFHFSTSSSKLLMEHAKLALLFINGRVKNAFTHILCATEGITLKGDYSEGKAIISIELKKNDR